MSEATLAQIKELGRASLTSLVASVVDYGFVILLVELLGIWYLAAVIVGASLGAVACFVLCTRWVFGKSETEPGTTARRGKLLGFLVIYSSGLVLFVGLVYLLADGAGLHYLLSKVVGGTTVFALWNYPLQRHFVFGPEPARTARPTVAATAGLSSPRPSAAHV